MIDEPPGGGAQGGPEADRAGWSGDRPPGLRWVPRVGIGAWSFVGFVVATVIVITALAAVSEIVLPLTFAAVLAVIFKPLAGFLEHHRFKPTIAAGLIVLGLLAVTTGVVVATVQGITDQTSQIGASVDAATASAAASLEIDQTALDEVRAAADGAAPLITGGFVTHLVAGVSTLLGLAAGLILGALIMYYLLKDGTRLRRSAIAQIDPRLRDEVDDFVGATCRTLREYGRGRTVMSVMVAVVIAVAALLLGLPLVFTIAVANFIGGYIPYVGAFLGGGLAVIVALGDGGLGVAALMLVIVLAANLLLENFVEPNVMGSTLHIHPVVVIIVTALGGLVGGIVGLILAVPATVIAADGITRLRSRGVLDQVADQAQPTLQRVLD